MSEDLEALLARVESEMGEEERAAFEQAIAAVAEEELNGGGGSRGQDGKVGNPAADEAMAGQLKARGSGSDEGSVPDGAVTEDELEARLEAFREEALTHEELAEVIDDLEASTREALMDALPEITEDVGQKMAASRVDYTGAIGEAFGTGGTPTGLEPGRTPTGSGGGTSQKMDTDDSESVDYTEDIQGAFGADE